jgi:hypothetical protein
VVNWNSFTPSDFEYDFEQDKLATRHVDLEEAIECFFQISRSGGTKNIAIDINSSVEPLLGESSR